MYLALLSDIPQGDAHRYYPIAFGVSFRGRGRRDPVSFSLDDPKIEAARVVKLHADYSIRNRLEALHLAARELRGVQERYLPLRVKHAFEVAIAFAQYGLATPIFSGACKYREIGQVPT